VQTNAERTRDLASRWKHWLWDEHTELPASERTLKTISRFAVALATDVRSGELTLRAASLVFTSMLGVVPLLALSFSVLKGLGMHHRLEPLLLRFLAPLGSQAQQVSDRVIGFVDNVEGSVLAGLSLGLLLVTIISMAQKIEASFNFVWHVAKPRTLARRISDYLSLTLAGPLLFSVALGLIAAIENTSVIARLRSVEPFGSVLAFIGQLSPYVVVIAAFAFLYGFVPNTRVRWRSALVGGLFGGTAWVASGYAFTAFLGGTDRNEAIYSGFAAVIAAMGWLYVSWLVLLLGAQLAFYCQNPFWLRNASRQTRQPLLPELLALAVLLRVGRAFKRGEAGMRVEQLAAALNVARHELEPVIDSLEQAGLLVHTESGQQLPAQDLERIRITDILRAARRSHPLAAWMPPADQQAALSGISARVDQGIDTALGGQSLADLVAEPTTRT
jgi:membrane protein